MIPAAIPQQALLLYTSWHAPCGSTSRAPRPSSADKPGRFYAWLLTETLLLLTGSIDSDQAP